MCSFKPDDLDEIILSYLGDEEPASCPGCGLPVRVHSRVVPAFGLQLQVECRSCALTGEWQQPQPERSWKGLHLEYFLEAFREERPIRCPIDDSFVSHAEFENGVVQFICPYCNRRGQISWSNEAPD